MPVFTLAAADLPEKLSQVDAVIDARSPSEWSLDHLPGALNWPVLDDEQRARIGTIYKQVSPFEAQKLGAAWVARRVADHIETHLMNTPKSWRPLIYCWRGGKRSGSMAHILSQVGFAVHLLEGGYKAYRSLVSQQLQSLPPTLHWVVLCGETGSGKSRLLQGLAAQGEQVLDLEALANHRGSMLGWVPGMEQPSQKAFESRLWGQLIRFQADRPVFVESESAMLGRLRVPPELMQCIREAQVIDVRVDLPDRVELLCQDYPHFMESQARLDERLQALLPLKGKAQVDEWLTMSAKGELRPLVSSLLSKHYDPIYRTSMARNFLAPAERRRDLAWTGRTDELAQAVSQLQKAVQSLKDGGPHVRL